MRFQNRRAFTVLLLLGLLLNLIAGAPTSAQNAKGTIRGHVVDPSGDVLQGAQIILEQSNVAMSTDVLGQFFVRDLQPGTYTVTISYVGFKEVSKSVEVVAGQVASIDVKMEVLSESTEVLVTAERATGEAAEVNRERSADNIVQVLSADVIRSLPNANMADALGRLPSVSLERDEGEGKYVQVRGTEPRLTNTTVDGVNVPSPESGVARSSSMPFPRTSLSPWKSTRSCRPTWTVMASAAPSIW
jgi:Carboxypeptidase regulatory-like domain/TonB-dependent Receptor Plug Domain